MGVDELGEAALKAGEHVVEGKCVGREVDPLGAGGKNGKGLAGPKTVGLAPVSDIGNRSLHVLVESFHIAFPLKSTLISLNILKDDASPLGVVNFLVYLLDNIGSTVFLDANIVDILDVLCELLVSLVVSVVNGATIKAHNTGEAVVVVDGSSGGDLGTETVTTDCGKGNLVLVHEANDIV